MRRSYARARAELRNVARWSKLLEEQDEFLESVLKRKQNADEQVKDKTKDTPR
ncbi:hypothetical protein [Candidatus Nitrospira bockiana]